MPPTVHASEPKREQVVTKDDYVAVKPNGGRCVDERGDKDGENLGAQMPGGAEHIMDLLLVAVKKSGMDIDEAVLFELVGTVYGSEAAGQHNLLPGVHIDDEHGKLQLSETHDRDAGCGYDKVRAQVLKTVFDLDVYSSPGQRIRTARGRGWGVQVLTGNHRSPAANESVTAAINYMKGTTLRTKTLWEQGRVPSFNHDIWVVETLLPETRKQLDAKGYTQASLLLGENAVQWSKEIYGETLNVLSGGVLTGESLIEIRE